MSGTLLFQESKSMIDELLQAANGLIGMANGETVDLGGEEETEELPEPEPEPAVDLAELEALGLYDAQLQEVELGIRKKRPLDADEGDPPGDAVGGGCKMVHESPVQCGADAPDPAGSGVWPGRVGVCPADLYRVGHVQEGACPGGVRPPQDDGRAYTIAELRRLLKKYEVRHGILADGLHEATIEGTRGKEILIAQGIPPMPGRDGYYELAFDRELPDAPELLADGSVDYTHVVLADTAQPGEKLAEYRPAGKGKSGMTVTGIAIDGEKGRELPPLTGSGIAVDSEKRVYTAAIKGYVTYDAERCKLSVMQTYLVNGDVNSYSGSVIYDGTVHVSGCVSGKAVIRATGDVVVDGFVSGGSIEAGNNVILRSGVNAADQGSIQADGRIMGKFFERVRLTAGSGQLFS